MKITVIEGNYGPQGREAAYSVLPDSTLLRSQRPFFIPDFDTEFLAFVSPAVRIEKLGKCVARRFARRYFTEYTAAINIRPANLPARLKSRGLPDGAALVFDKALICGDFLPYDSPADGAELTFPDITVKVDGETAAVWTASMANGDAAAAVELASVNNTLKTGDLILTALHCEGVKLRHPARLTAEIGGVTVLDIPLR